MPSLSIHFWNVLRRSFVAVECIAISFSIREETWLSRLCAEILSTAKMEARSVFVNNQGCISIAKTDSVHSRTKQIEVKFQYEKGKLKDKTIVLEYIPTTNMTANIFNKN